MFSFLIVSLTFVSCGQKTETKTEYIQVPKVETIQVPVTMPGTTSVISVPQTIIIDKGFGIKSYPRSIAEASDKIKKLSRAVAKIMNSNYSSGTGFFISEDGLFLTNEHVMPIGSCHQNGCPGYKIIRDFRAGGENETYTDFEVLAQSDSSQSLDFTLLKVKLPEGKKTPFLELELDRYEYNFQEDNKRTYKVLGHPGGASLRFTNARPLKQKGFNLELLTLLLGGNSGGPLIDDQSGRVIGLVKAIRTAFIREDSETSSHQTRARATSILDIIRNLKTHKLVPNVIAKINSRGIKLVELTEAESEPVVAPKKELELPSRTIFLSALRKESQDPNSSKAIEQLDKYLGTPFESTVLDMMFEKTDLHDSDLNKDSLTSLFKKQILLGRSLKISDKYIESLNSDLLSKEVTGSDITLAILMNYSNKEIKDKLQKRCRDALPSFVMVFPAVMYSCVTTENNDGESYIPRVVEYLKNSTYDDVDDFGVATAVGMIVSIPGVIRQEDQNALIDLVKFLDLKNKDIEVLVQSDSFFMNAITGSVGPGSFSKTFPEIK